MSVPKIAIVAMSILILAGCEKADNARKDEQGLSARYQIIFSPHVRADTFLLDTQKGKVWQLTSFPDLEGKPTAWKPVLVIDPTGKVGLKEEDFLSLYPPVKK